MPPVLLSDLDRCRPAAALADTFAPERRRVLPYVADGIPDGRMLGAGELSRAPAIAYPLARTGWFRISVGVFNGFWRPYREQRLELRLAGDAAWSTLVLPPPSDLPWGIPLDDDDVGPRITEVPWRTVELRGEDLLLRQPRAVPLAAQTVAAQGAEGYVAYLRLDPLAPHEAPGRDPGTRRLFAYDDTWNAFFEHLRPLTPDDGADAYRTQIEVYRDTDVARIYWEGAHGDVCHYPTRVGRTWDAVAGGSWPRAGDRNVVETWRGWRAAGFDPYALAVQHAHDAGLQIHATYRFGWGAFYWPPAFDAYNAGGFFDRHPEWRCIRPDGTPDTALSLAFPQVRAFIVDVLRELAAYEVDGLALLFNGQPPFAGTEAPDPLAPATCLLEEIRAAIPGLPLTAWVFGARDQNMAYGLDVETWVGRRLVDTIVPYSSEPKGFSWGDAWTGPAAIAYWTNLVRGSGVLLAPNVMPRDLDDAGHRRQALRLYRAGVEALSFWDTFLRRSLWTGAIPRLGHRDELEAWEAAGEPAAERRTRRIREVAGWQFGLLPE